ncbi:hypothetical protein PR048_010488 [Dryococelus australis]|uniref:Uncharacterized protein n=1 Tax=Dryococelus australis TaxID=614101 RepID=A0ABQ9I3Z7_9NEOP|nr:hypothetical protein PR048_010488 [Dryococelus australis]
MEKCRNERAGKREIPEKTRRPAVSSSAIATCETLKYGYENFANSFRDKINVKHIYSEVIVAIGSQFIRPALHASDAIADLQGKPCESHNCQRHSPQQIDVTSQQDVGTPLTNQRLVTYSLGVAQPTVNVSQHAVASETPRLPPRRFQVQSPAGTVPDLHRWESCRTIPLVGGFSRESPVSQPFNSGAAPYPPRSTLIGTHISSTLYQGIRRRNGGAVILTRAYPIFDWLRDVLRMDHCLIGCRMLRTVCLLGWREGVQVLVGERRSNFLLAIDGILFCWRVRLEFDVHTPLPPLAYLLGSPGERWSGIGIVSCPTGKGGASIRRRSQNCLELDQNIVKKIAEIIFSAFLPVTHCVFSAATLPREVERLLRLSPQSMRGDNPEITGFLRRSRLEKQVTGIWFGQYQLGSPLVDDRPIMNAANLDVLIVGTSPYIRAHCNEAEEYPGSRTSEGLPKSVK